MSFTTTDSTSGFFADGWYCTCGVWVCAGSTHVCHRPFTCLIHPWATLPCGWCDQQQQIIKRLFNPAPAPESAGGEEPMSLIDERQVEVLDAFRAARDTAKRHAQSKVDRATMMKIQAEALIAEARELVAELNEDTPYPMEQGADIGPVKGAGGDRR